MAQNGDGLSLPRPHNVGHQPVTGKVATADDIAPPSRGQGHPCPVEIAAGEALGHDFGRRLRGRIGILAPQGVGLHKGPAGLGIGVDLIGGDNQTCL